MPSKDCVECGAPFDDFNEDWRIRCYRCWKARKERKASAPGTAVGPTWTEYRALQERLREVEERLAVTDRNAIPEDRLRQLIALAHPDRHNGSRVSTEITGWLLSLRAKQR